MGPYSIEIGMLIYKVRRNHQRSEEDNPESVLS